MRDVLAATGTSPWLTGSMGKVAVTAAVLLALGGTLMASHPWKSARVAEEAKIVASAVPAAPESLPVQKETAAVPLAVPASRPAPSKDQLEAESAADTIQITPGKTLLRICVDRFGKCGPEMLQEIHRLNPGLSNLDHIEVGQSLRIPQAPRVSRASATEPGPQGERARQ